MTSKRGPSLAVEMSLQGQRGPRIHTSFPCRHTSFPRRREPREGKGRWEKEDGAEDGVRTRGLLLGKEMLYH